MRPIFQRHLFYLMTFTLLTASVSAQLPNSRSSRPDANPERNPGIPPFGAGPGDHRGGPGGEEQKLVKQFDQDQDGMLNNAERQTARQYLKENPPQQRGPGGPGGFGPPHGREADQQTPRDPGRRSRRRGPMQQERPAARTGKKISPADVPAINADLYAPFVLRTIFVDFENKDWETELEAFHGSDVEVPATLTVDGQKYPDCGIHFRGMSSYMMVPQGYKRSLNISLDFLHEDQRLQGYKTLNLLNNSGDDSLLSTVLYSHLARKYMPAPKANLVRVVINGENWGIYTNAQQFNKDFLREHYPSAKGTRWKVSGSPRGGGGLDYRGEDPERYGYPYEMKDGKQKSLKKLIELCRILDQTPPDQLQNALADKVDLDELLWFLALDNALCNADGYWIRASDYSIFLDKQDRFHFFPHDMNEAFRFAGRGPGMGPPGHHPPGFRSREAGAGPRGENPPAGPGLPFSAGGPPRGVFPPANFDPHRANQNNNATEQLDPLIGLDDPQKPLRSKLLAVPEIRAEYLKKIRIIAGDLDWKELGPVVNQFRKLIAREVRQDTRKLGSYENFIKLTNSRIPTPTSAGHGPGGHAAINLHQFAKQRSEYLLKVTSGK
ncbi:CotH kinase family protein [Gimesia sp.]|uniref:CotH kinase family protein n=1 Tax=Gimesia sp. TaxID=2024833 RepID=UPI003A94760B